MEASQRMIFSPKEVHRKLENSAGCNGAQTPSSRLLAAVFGQTRLDKYPSQGKLTAHATPWAKQIQHDIEDLREFGEGFYLCGN